MKVIIKRTEESRGIVFKKTVFGLHVRYELNDEEQAVYDAHKKDMKDLIVGEVDDERGEVLRCYLSFLVEKGITFRGYESIGEANRTETFLREAAPKAKQHIMAHATFGGSESVVEV